MKTKFTYYLLVLLLSPVFLMGQNEVKDVNYRSWIRKNADSKNKLALVIGNSEYIHGGRLAEPAKDAETIAAALIEQGYDVEIGYNLDRSNLFEAIKTFAIKFESYQSALVYYAGHGFQIEGENYLIPVDAQPRNEFEAQEQCVNVEAFFRASNQPDKPKVVILDACRNNPFASNTRSAGSGIGSINTMLNAKIIFSTAKNTVVQDDNPFTEILSEQIRNGGCINSILGKVSKEVRKVNPSQLIWQEGLLEEDICFGELKNTVQETVGIDTDNDGVFDDKDICPNQKGLAKNSGCPDSDSDGIIDLKDLCPERAGLSKNSGCPDSDKDGIMDDKDACPNQFGLPENKGCPEHVASSEENGDSQKISKPSSKVLNGNFTDERDGNSYEWVRLKDGNTWMSQNLNFNIEDSFCYDEKKRNCNELGRLYTWDAAKKACPKGWRLPTDEDWKLLINLYGGESEAFDVLTQDDKTNLRAIFAGVRDPKGNYIALDSFGQYWSSKSDAAKARYFDFNKIDDQLNTYENNKNWALSCRCIQE